MLPSEPGTIFEAVESFTAAFGRVERVSAGGRQLLMILARNPAGSNEVITVPHTDPRAASNHQAHARW